MESSATTADPEVQAYPGIGQRIVGRRRGAAVGVALFRSTTGSVILMPGVDLVAAVDRGEAFDLKCVAQSTRSWARSARRTAETLWKAAVSRVPGRFLFGLLGGVALGDGQCVWALRVEADGVDTVDEDSVLERVGECGEGLGTRVSGNRGEHDVGVGGAGGVVGSADVSGSGPAQGESSALGAGSSEYAHGVWEGDVVVERCGHGV